MTTYRFSPISRVMSCLVASGVVLATTIVAPLSTPAQEIEVGSYAAHVLQTGGVGSRLTTKTAWLLTEHAYIDAEKYVRVDFNSGGDLIWVFPMKGYRIRKCSSPSENQVHIEEKAAGCGILLEDKLKNEILVEFEAIPTK